MAFGGVYDELFHAAEYGIPGDVQTLIDKGLDINVRDRSKRTLLIVSIINSHPDVALILIKSGANLDLSDREGFTPLMLAIQQNMQIIPKMLISENCNVNVQNNYNETALHIALKTCESTMNDNIDTDGEYSHSDQFIQRTIQQTQDLVKLLTSSGCNINVKNIRSQIALHFTSKISVCAKYLLELGSAVNVVDTMKRTPLTVAIENRSIEVIELLLNHCANPNLGGSLNFDLWFYPLDPLQFKILTLLLKNQWRCPVVSIAHAPLKNSGVKQTETYDSNKRLSLLQFAFVTGSCTLSDLSHLIYHVDFKKTWQSNDKISKWLEENYNRPMSLKNISRIYILEILIPNRDININELIIPRALHGFLRFNDMLNA